MNAETRGSAILSELRSREASRGCRSVAEGARAVIGAPAWIANCGVCRLDVHENLHVLEALRRQDAASFIRHQEPISLVKDSFVYCCKQTP